MSKIITTHLTVNAPVEAVWQTLSDLASYHTWNPFITGAAGTFSVGERLDLTIQPPGSRPMVFKPWVTAVEEHHPSSGRGVWRCRASSTVGKASHSPRLRPVAPWCTVGTFTGALVPFTGPMLARTRAGFTAMNEALAMEVTRSRTQACEDPAKSST